MRLLKHRIVKAPTDKAVWRDMKFDTPTIFTGVTREVMDYLGIYRSLDSFKNRFGDNYFYFLPGAISDNVDRRYAIILIREEEDYKEVIEHLESTVILKVRNTYNYLRKPSEFTNLLALARAQEAIFTAASAAQVYRKRYMEALTTQQDEVEKYRRIRKRAQLWKKAGITNGVKYFTFENVIAEDTDADGVDIDLGTLTFSVNFDSDVVRIHDGSYAHPTEYSSNAFHPHDLGTTICLGSQSADMITAIQNVEISIIQAILHKFAHSYTSSDSAGSYWKKWAGEEYDDMEDMVWSEYHDRDVNIEDCENIDGDWIERDCLVTLRDGSRYPEGWSTFCEYEDVWVNDNEVVWSKRLESNLYEMTAVELELGRGWMPEEHEDVVEFGDRYYYIEDTVSDIEGEQVPTHLTVYSYALSAHILKSEAIEVDGEWYTENTLPGNPDDAETTEVTETTETETTEEVPTPVNADFEEVLTPVDNTEFNPFLFA